jgi:hypothetical protein
MAHRERCSQNRLYGKKLPRPIWVSRNSPEWGIDISNTAAVIIAIDFFSAGLIVHESPFDELQ